jgi:hypothetical protein
MDGIVKNALLTNSATKAMIKLENHEDFFGLLFKLFVRNDHNACT